MIAKMIEIRDAMTFIPALAVKMTSDHVGDDYLLRRAGYVQEVCVLLVWLARDKANYDPHAWGSRTLEVAHEFVRKNFDLLQPGSVVDVEHILGKSETPKRSERYESPIA